MVFNRNGVFSGDDGRRRSIRMPWTRSATDCNEWRSVNFAFMSALFRKRLDGFPSRNATRMNVGMFLSDFGVAMRNDTANVNVEIICDGLCLSIRDFRPLMLWRRLICLAADGAQQKNIHVGAVVENSIRLDQLDVG